MRDNFEKLNQLLEQEQCEFTGIPDGFAGQTPDRKLRLIYLMNDCAEFPIPENSLRSHSSDRSDAVFCPVSALQIHLESL